MHSSLIAAVLCVLAQSAAACIAAADDAQPVAARSPIHVVKTQPPGTPLKAGATLITTANAGTRDAPGAMRQAPVAARATPLAGAQSEEPPRRAGPAMLLAALALMSGIALRRYGAGRQ
jgi:hypothetical protein